MDSRLDNCTATEIDLAAQLKAWRGDSSIRQAAEVLGIPHRTLEGVEQGRGFRYPELLLHALNTMTIEGKNNG
jgi:hypothetical protein